MLGWLRDVDLSPLLFLDQSGRFGETNRVICNQERSSLNLISINSHTRDGYCTCEAVTPLRDTIIRFASVSVATTNSQFSLNSSTKSVRESAACCSDLTARILEAREFASSHADERTSARLERVKASGGLEGDRGGGPGTKDEMDRGVRELRAASQERDGERARETGRKGASYRAMHGREVIGRVGSCKRERREKA